MNDIIWLQFLRCVFHFPTNSPFREFWESFAKLSDIVTEIADGFWCRAIHVYTIHPL